MTAVARATYRVEVSWEQDATGLFVIGSSLLDSAAPLAADSWSSTFSGTLDDISADVAAIQTRRGRSDDLSTVNAGTATITLRDAAGRYNVANAASDLAGVLDKPRPVRITATLSGVTYGVFYGFIRRIQFEPRGRGGEARIECVDLFRRMSRQKPVIASTGPTTVGTVVGLILDELEWTDPAMRSLDTGSSIPDFSADGSRDALTLIGELLGRDLGTVFVTKTGAVAYRDRNARLSAVSAATIEDEMRAIAPGVDHDTVRTRWTVTRDGGTPQTVADAAAERVYGVVEDSLTTPYLSTDSDAYDLAAYLAFLTSTPRPPIWQLAVDNRTDALLTQALAREFGDRITVAEAQTGTSGDYFVEQIEHDIRVGRDHYSHRCGWLLSQVPFDVFVVGTSTLDSASLIAY